MTPLIVQRLRSYYTMDAGKPMFDSSKRVHRAADLAEAADTIDELYTALDRFWTEWPSPSFVQPETMDAVKAVLAKVRAPQ
jgi:hypothetical protein